MQVIAHDFETTGVKPKTCGVVQSAIAIVDIHEKGTYEIIAEEVSTHHPGGPIPAGASKVHGIYDRHVADLPDFEESLCATYEQATAEFSPTASLGYNSLKFDDVIARRCGMPDHLISVDLMIAAQRLMARGYLKRARLVDAYEGLTGQDAVNAHDAMADLTMTLDLIFPSMQLLGIGTFDEFVQWLNRPEANPDMPMPFGKHKGDPLKDIPKRYLKWLLNDADDINADLKVSAQAVLEANRR